MREIKAMNADLQKTIKQAKAQETPSLPFQQNGSQHFHL